MSEIEEAREFWTPEGSEERRLEGMPEGGSCVWPSELRPRPTHVGANLCKSWSRHQSPQPPAFSSCICRARMAVVIVSAPGL